jgi:type II secretory pathway pseudopilin PulG
MKKYPKSNNGFTLIESVISAVVLVTVLSGIVYAVSMSIRSSDETLVEAEALGRMQGLAHEIGSMPWDTVGSPGWPHTGTIDYLIASGTPIKFSYTDIPGNGTIMVTNNLDGLAGVWQDARVPSVVYDGTYNIAKVVVQYVTENKIKLEIETYFPRPR